MTPRRPVGGPRPAGPSELARVLLASATLHGAVLGGLAWHPAPAPEDRPEPAALQVEYVNQAAGTRGAPAATAPAPSSQPGAQGGAPPSPQAPEPAAAADVPLPAPPGARQAEAAPPAVNLGNADEDRDALLVTGDNVVSSGPDAKYRNMPPAYPHEAIRRHQQGTVQVLVHITPTGEAGEVEMVTSSGSSALDNAARDAVAKWHFTPPVRDGTPIASVFPLQMNFRSEP